MNIKPKRLRELIFEEITQSDKTEIKKMISKEVESALKSRKTKEMIQDELKKLLKKNDIKQDIGDITKKVLRALYKDMSVNHPYMIDRITV
jgi:hypothetical protein|tara:strand:+ start:1358 stop:1630 length:273 start_codon:yes stop_codon:yes gene_type:complete